MLFFAFKTAAERTFAEAQFHFPVHPNPDALEWMGHPEHFRVEFIGQIVGFPNPTAIREVGPSETWIVMVSSTHFTVGRDTPLCLVCPLRVFLAEKLYGVIMPKKYPERPAA